MERGNRNLDNAISRRLWVAPFEMRLLFLKIAAFVIPLGFDTLAVAVILGLRGTRPLRPALTFAFFEAVMPLIGLLLGRLIGARVETPAVVLGGLVLLAVALYMLKELEEQDETDELSFTSMRTAALAGFGISMDEVAIGFPMGTSGLPVPETIGAIAVQAFIVSFVGIVAGRPLGATLGQRTSRVARIVAAVAFGILGIYLIAQRFVPGLPEI